MRLSEIEFSEAPPIDSYGPGMFRIAGIVHEGALVLSGTNVLGWGGYDDVEPLAALNGEIDVLFVGTGENTAHVPPEFRSSLEAAGIGVEPMATPAACRTYNILLSEGRRVAVALLPV